MLREPLGGLRRAGAVVITHADQVAETVVESIERTIRRYNATAPLHRATHAHPAIRSAGVAASAPPDHSPTTCEAEAGSRSVASATP
jgi:G3E family GTPase